MNKDQINRLDFGGSQTGLSLNTSVREDVQRYRLLPILQSPSYCFGLLIAWLLQLLRRWILERRRARQALRERDELLQHTARPIESGRICFTRYSAQTESAVAAIATYSAAGGSINAVARATVENSNCDY